MAKIASLAEIRDEILGNDIAKRIVIKVKTKTLDAEDYRVSATNLVNEVFPDWESDSRILFVAINVSPKRTFIVVEINHLDYDFDTAHKTKKVFPAYVLRQANARSWALVRWPPEDTRLGGRIAYLHYANGFDVAPPFFEDHHTRVVYANPREFVVWKATYYGLSLCPRLPITLLTCAPREGTLRLVRLISLFTFLKLSYTEPCPWVCCLCRFQNVVHLEVRSNDSCHMIHACVVSILIIAAWMGY